MFHGMDGELRRQLDELVERGGAELVGQHPFVPMLVLESTMRVGLTHDGCSDSFVWALADGQTLTLFSASTAAMFVEVFEHRRDDFESRLGQGAAGVGLPAEATAWSFPAVQLVRAMLASPSPHFRRCALGWLLTTELRELRADILRVAADTATPTALRELARRMVVPE